LTLKGFWKQKRQKQSALCKIQDCAKNEIFKIRDCINNAQNTSPILREIQTGRHSLTSNSYTAFIHVFDIICQRKILPKTANSM